MRSEFEIASVAIGAAYGLAAGAVQHVVNGGEALPGLALAALSGVCGIFGSLFYAARENESAWTDIAASVVVAFIASFAIGSFVGSGVQALILKLLPDADMSYVAAFGPYMLGGLVVGAFVVPAFRVGMAWFKALGEFVATKAIDVFNKIFGGKP